MARKRAQADPQPETLDLPGDQLGSPGSEQHPSGSSRMTGTLALPRSEQGPSKSTSGTTYTASTTPSSEDVSLESEGGCVPSSGTEPEIDDSSTDPDSSWVPGWNDARKQDLHKSVA